MYCEEQPAPSTSGFDRILHGYTCPPQIPCARLLCDRFGRFHSGGAYDRIDKRQQVAQVDHLVQRLHAPARVSGRIERRADMDSIRVQNGLRVGKERLDRGNRRRDRAGKGLGKDSVKEYAIRRGELL